MAGKGVAGGSSQWSHQQQQQTTATTSPHLLSPNSAALADARHRRRSTLSNHGFFIEYSGRRNSCAPNQHRQPLAHLALVSPVRGTLDNEGCEAGQSSGRMAPGGRQSQASCSTRIGQQLVGPHTRSHSLMPPISAPSALVGSRKTSIFDPAGHSLASSQLLSASAAASCDVTRRRSTMTMGPAALAAQQQMLAVAKNHSAAGVNAGKRTQTLVQQVPVIGCSPTSIQGSLQALDESRRYEKMLRTLREHQRQKEIRRRKRRHRLKAVPLTRSTSQQQQQQQEQATTAGREESHSLRRAIKNAAKGLLGSRASHQPQTATKSGRHEQLRLSVSALSLGSWSTSNESESSSCATSDSEFGSRASSVGSLSPNTERLTLGHPSVRNGQQSQQQKSFMSQAFRKLASLSASSPSVANRHHSTRSAPPSSTTANQNYWHYYYYLKENSIDHNPCLGADELLVAGELLSPKKRRERLNANFSLARLEILNCGATCRPNPGELMQAHELAAQGRPEMLARMFSQSTDISLALSTSSSSHSSSSNLSLVSSSSHEPRGSVEPEDSSTENWSLTSSIQLESAAIRLSSSDESTATAVGHSGRPVSWVRSAPSTNHTSTAETSFSTRQAAICRSSPHSSASTKSVAKKKEQATTKQDEDEEEDDFERLNRCHRGYKLKAAELLEMMQQQEPVKRSRRNSSQRLSVRSVRSIGSPAGLSRDVSKCGGKLGAASTNLTNTHAISLSWGTLNQVQTTTTQNVASSRQTRLLLASSEQAAPLDYHSTLSTGSQLAPARKAEARRCTSASLGPPNLRRHRLVQSKSSRLNISANDLGLSSMDSSSTGNPSNWQSLAAGELRARAHSTGSKWNQPEASKSTPARLSGSSCLLAASSQEPPPLRDPPLARVGRKSACGPQASSSQQEPPDEQRTRLATAETQSQELAGCAQDERLQLFELVRKGSFSCMVLGARQTGKRSIVKCFVKLLNEFKLAVAEYRKEKMLTQLLGCSQQLQGILQQQQQHQEDGAPGNGLMRSRVNSWFAGGPVNRLLPSNSGRQARNSTCLADRGLGRQSSPVLAERTALANEDNPMASNTTTPDNRFLCVASAHGINKSDTSIDYQSTTHENGNFSLSFQVPTTTLHSRSLGPAGSASAHKRTQKRRARTKLRRLLSLKELNKKRIRIRFSSRRKLASRLLKESLSSGTPHLLDVYLVVYAINDRDSFTEAGRILKELSTLRRASDPARYVPVILVANKVDLERAKVVKNEEGKALARKNQCKFMEISCAVGFNLDNLLVGIRTQLVLKHHVDLNSYLGDTNKTTADKKGQVTEKDVAGKTVREHNRRSTEANRKQNIIMRFYRRYVTDNFADDNYECDNFSVL